MKTLPAPKFLIYAVLKALRHPRTPIRYYYCSNCRVRFPASANECPKCGDKVGESPENRKESPVPWCREGQYFMLMLNFETSGGSNPRSSLKKNWLACQPGVLPVIPLSFIKSLFIKFRPSLPIKSRPLMKMVNHMDLIGQKRGVD